MKKNLFIIGLAGLGLALGSLGCHTTDNSQPAAAQVVPEVPIPADSPFAKIKLGMDMAQVYATIGQPTDTTGHITGKAFIPYYFGGDTHRLVALYKGLGRVTFAPPNAFSSDMRAIEIHYDPAEPGFNN